MKLLHDNRGETLIEMLATILVAALSVTLLFSCVTTSFKLDSDAQKLDEAHFSAFSDAEVYVAEPDATPVPGTVTITLIDPTPELGEPCPSVAPTVEIYGGEGMYSYKGIQP